MTEAFRRVDAHAASAAALGILIPPGKRTFAILRPRSLPWDLLPATWDRRRPPSFCTFTRDEAVQVARELMRALARHVTVGTSPILTVADPSHVRFQLWVLSEPYVWVTCRRTPGSPYLPAVFASEQIAQEEARRLEDVVFPTAAQPQEYYFNTQQFKDL